MSKYVLMVAQSLKINYVPAAYNAGFFESLFYMVFPCPEKRGAALSANTFENLSDDFVGPRKHLNMTHILPASEQLKQL